MEGSSIHALDAGFIGPLQTGNLTLGNTVFRDANKNYAADSPAVVSPQTTTEPTPFMDLIPTIFIRENDHRTQTERARNPHWHQPTDVYSTYSDKDFRLGLNAAQTTLGAIGQLVVTKLK